MWLQTIVPVAANTPNIVLIAANPKRLRLKWQVTGAAAATISPVAPSAVGQGFTYQPNGVIESFVLDNAQEAFFVYAGTATSVTIWEFVQNGGVSATTGAGANNLNATP